MKKLTPNTVHNYLAGTNMPHKSILALACTLAITGCASNRINSGTEAVKQQSEPVIQQAIAQKGLVVTAATVGTATYADSQAKAVKNQPVAMRSTGAWYGQRTVPVLSDSVLPQVFKENFAIDFDGYRGGRVPIAVVAERLSRMTGVPVRVKQDVYGSKNSQSSAPVTPAPMSLGAGTTMNLPMPVGKNTGIPAGTPILPTQSEPNPEAITTDVASVSMKWNGSLERFLDHITGMLNLSWGYRDGVVVIERYVTESFEVEGLGGSQSYKMSLGGGNSGSGGGTGFGNASESLEVQESGKSAPLESLKKTIEALVLPTGGSVTLNEGSGRLIVVTSKDVLSRVREIVRVEVAVMRRQTIIQLDIYSVVSKTNDEYGVDWSGFINDLASTWTSTITTPASLVSSAAGGLGYTLLKDVPTTSTQGVKNTAARYGGSKVLINALHQMGDSAQYRPISLVAKNRQWARKTNLNTTGYLAETTPSTSSAAGSGAPGIKASSVTTGEKFMIQPAIMDDGSVDLKFGISLSDLIGLFSVSSGIGTSLQTIQAPEVSATGDHGDIHLQAGESMVITGLSKQISTSDRNGLAEEVPVVLGGSKKRSYKRENFLIVVRAVPVSF